MSSEEHAAPPALGLVIEADRGSLPFALVHGEALVTCAAWGLGDAGVQLVDLGTAWADLAEADEPVVLHDALCPMTPADFIAACVRIAVEDDIVVVGVLGEGADQRVASPVVLPASVVGAIDAAEMAAALRQDDLEQVVSLVGAGHDVRRVSAPPDALRVRSLDDVARLEQQTTPVRP